MPAVGLILAWALPERLRCFWLNQCHFFCRSLVAFRFFGQARSGHNHLCHWATIFCRNPILRLFYLNRCVLSCDGWRASSIALKNQPHSRNNHGCAQYEYVDVAGLVCVFWCRFGAVVGAVVGASSAAFLFVALHRLKYRLISTRKG